MVCLVAATAMFAGLWANDQPDRILAQKTPPRGNPLVQSPSEKPVPTRENAVAVKESVEQEQVFWQPTRPEVRQVSVEEIAPRIEQIAKPVYAVALGTMEKTIRVEGEELSIEAAELSKHLMQLPMGIPVGDYRIVDSLGGVGWLRVRTLSLDAELQVSSDLYTTTVDGRDVRFIPVSHVAGPTEIPATR